MNNVKSPRLPSAAGTSFDKKTTNPQPELTRDGWFFCQKSSDNALSNNDFKSIIASSHLFWLAFCKASSMQNNQKYTEFSVKLNLYHPEITLSGYKYDFLEIQQSVEKIRSFFDKGLEETNVCAFVLLELAHKIYIRNKIEIVDLRDWLTTSDNISTYDFEDHILPCLPSLSNMLGVICTIKQCDQKFLNHSNDLRSQLSTYFEMEWKSI